MILSKIAAFFLFFIITGAVLMNPFYITIEQGLHGKVVVIDAGGNDGAVLELALKLKARLEAAGAEVLLTRENENDVPLPVRCALINKLSLEALKEKDHENAAELDELIGKMHSVIRDPGSFAGIYFNYPFDFSYEREIHPDLSKIFEYQEDPLIKDNFLVISLYPNAPAATAAAAGMRQNTADMFFMSNDIERNRKYYNYYSHLGRSYYFADLLAGDIGRLGFETRDIRDNHYFMLREHNIPGILVEKGFYIRDTSKLADIYAETVSYYFLVTDEIYPRSLPDARPILRNLQGRTVILDAGHGLGNTNIYEGYDEQVAMLKLALMIKPRLEALGAEVLLTRADEEYVSHGARCARINKWALEALMAEGAGDAAELRRLIKIMEDVIEYPSENASVYFNTPFDNTYTRTIHPDLQRIFEYQGDPLIRDRFLFFSLHSNATGRPINTSANGVEVYFISNETQGNSNYFTGYSNPERSYFLGNALLEGIIRLDMTNRGVKNYNFFMLREHNLPATLAENGFHTNPEDRAKLQDDEFLSALADTYTERVLLYFDLYDEMPDIWKF